ncbi:glycerol-3-phosphate responsive antiterminator [Priestia flexa]|uniref:glycerol-3-phosphate responsive antiterminator n=1 Tax=Priestia flexa TaxID=86664 RepID=UPI001CFE8B66|nr:glycerol-3-phosphate responsive antiterminator [Priestia flexa]
MSFHGQSVLPAVRDMKQLERFLASEYEHGVLLDNQVGLLRGIMKEVHRHQKKMIIHLDLIHGLKQDEYAVDFLCQELKPAGIISTRTNVILKAKQRGIYAIQRVFLLDSTALKKSYELIKKVEPDFIELLPGIIPSLLKEVAEETGIPVLAGGLIRTEEEVKNAIAAGAAAVTTSNKQLWNTFK